jgi:hypothetical protein
MLLRTATTKEAVHLQVVATTKAHGLQIQDIVPQYPSRLHNNSPFVDYLLPLSHLLSSESDDSFLTRAFEYKYITAYPTANSAVSIRLLPSRFNRNWYIRNKGIIKLY